ncbi:MAG: hypothetical protein WBD16_09385 [Pyrinomonadaceae bacterium]
MKLITTIFVLLLLSAFPAAFGQAPVAASGSNILKKDIQLKLDEWHKAGHFPGATLGVDLGDLEKLMTVD